MKNVIKNALTNMATDRAAALPLLLPLSLGELNQTNEAAIVDMIRAEINSFFIINMFF